MTESLSTWAGFAACAAVAALAQNATGFAFALVLLGLVALFELAPIATAANAASLLTLVHAAVHFGLHGLTPQWRLMRPALWASLPGVAAGVLLLAWLGANALAVLRAALGAVIVASAMLLAAGPRRRATPSGPGSLALAGAVSGLMGGLFASPGPPLVFQMARQPLAGDVVRQCLLLAFTLNAALRLTLVGIGGTLGSDAFVLAAAAAPAILGVGLWQRARPPSMPGALRRWLAAALLAAAGVSLFAGAVGGPG